MQLSTQYVESGKYVVSKVAGRCLVACLGTCVGLTLCDRKAKIGGLFHILLPAPTGTTVPLQPESYASTGLPLFIDAMCEAGADKDRLEACIAGGSLLGPVSKRDVNLDIGGRTTDIVIKTLQQHSIPVNVSETGGFSGRNLLFNLKSFDVTVEAVGVPQKTLVKFSRPSSEEIEGSIRKVQPVPQIALKIIRMINQKNYNTKEIAREVANDQIISARVISLCNSVVFALKNNISSIDRALVILGEKHLLRIVLSVAVEPSFPKEKQGYSLCKGGLFYHAMKTALLAENLAMATGKADPDVAYTAGLLHDIGKVVIDQYVDRAYPLFYHMTQEKARGLISAEQELLGTTHAEVGGLLARMWAIPDNLIDAIVFHHEPDKAHVSKELTHLVYLADIIVSHFFAGQVLNRPDAAYLSKCLQKLGISSDKLPLIIDLIPRHVFSHAKLF